MSDINTSQNFAPGDTVTDAKLNNIIDQATIQPAFISGKTVKPTPVGADRVVIWDSVSTTLKGARVDTIPGVASVAITSAIPGTTVTNTTPTGPAVVIAINQLPQSGNKVLASPVGGGAGPPAYRSLVPKDTAIAYVPISAYEIDWRLGNFFYKHIAVAAGNNFSFTGGTDGQTITVELSQGGSFGIAWPPGINWENGTPPSPSLSIGAGRIDFFQFWYLGGRALGKRILTNAF